MRHGMATTFVISGFVPGIYVFHCSASKDGRDKPGHDDSFYS
jgi:hypothetical protein